MAVSLAFRGSPKISEATRKRILSIARELNYVPNQAARQLRSGQTDIVGFLVTDLANPFHSLMIKHAQRAFSEMGLTLFTAGSDWNEEHERASVERLIRMRARGVLLCSCEKSPEPFELLDRAGIPYVALDSVPDTYGGPCVINDLAQCGALMADHFRAVGARKPAYVDAAADMLFFSAFRKTREAFRDTLHRAGIELSAENCIPAGMTLEAGAEAFRALIRISGVGPRIALALLSGLTVDQLAQAVESGEAGLLTRVPGIGKKTAERLLLELKGKLAGAAFAGASSAPASSAARDILSALVALGYSEREAAAAVKKLPEDTGVSDGIRLALKSLSR